MATLRATLAEALRQVDALAGPDRSEEISCLRQKAAGHANAALGPEEDERLRALAAAQQARSDWLVAHPEVVAYSTGIAQRVHVASLRQALGVAASSGHSAFSARDVGPDL